MTTDIITISKHDLYDLVRKAVSDELSGLGTISDLEQKEINELYGDIESNSNKNINFDECIEL
jgi:hypothetical protein